MGFKNLENMINIVLVALFTLAKAEVRGDLEDIVNELVMEMTELNAKVEYLEDNAKNLEKEGKAKDASIQKLEREVSLLKDPTFTYFSSYLSVTRIISQTITYEKLLYSSTNVEGAAMDISTGIFTSGWPGTYTVTWSLAADMDEGQPIMHIYLRMNGAKIRESLHSSFYTGPSGYVRDQGGRTLVLHLERGDTLDLWCEDCSARADDITF